MNSINVSITIVFTVILRFLWPGGAAAGGSNNTTNTDQGGDTSQAADQVAPVEQLRTADQDNNNSGLIEDDFPAEAVGPAEGEGGLEVDNDIIEEEEVTNDTGIGAAANVSLISFTEAETVVVPDGGRAVSEPRERPQAAGLGAGVWTRVRARLAGTPEHWYVCDQDCTRCNRIRNRRN